MSKRLLRSEPGDPESYVYPMETVAWASVGVNEETGWFSSREQHATATRGLLSILGCLDAPLGYDEDWQS